MSHNLAWGARAGTRFVRSRNLVYNTVVLVVREETGAGNRARTCKVPSFEASPFTFHPPCWCLQRLSADHAVVLFTPVSFSYERSGRVWAEIAAACDRLFSRWPVKNARARQPQRRRFAERRPMPL